RAELEDVTGTESIVCCDAERDRRINAGDLLDDQRVLDEAEPCAVVFGRDSNAEKPERCHLLEDLSRELLRLIELHDYRTDLLLSKVTCKGAYSKLLFIERSIVADGCCF